MGSLYYLSFIDSYMLDLPKLQFIFIKIICNVFYCKMILNHFEIETVFTKIEISNEWNINFFQNRCIEWWGELYTGQSIFWISYFDMTWRYTIVLCQYLFHSQILSLIWIFSLGTKIKLHKTTRSGIALAQSRVSPKTFIEKLSKIA